MKFPVYVILPYRFKTTLIFVYGTTQNARSIYYNAVRRNIQKQKKWI